LATRRDLFDHRLCAFGESWDELFHAAETAGEDVADRQNNFVLGRAKAEPTDAAFVFSGHGRFACRFNESQFRKMPAVFRHRLAEFEQMLVDVLPEPLIKMLLTPTDRYDAASAQPILAAVQIAFGQTLIEMGISPRFTLGHSIGEIAAAAVAG